MPTFIKDGYTLSYEIHGEGAPVVLLHGLTVSFTGNYAAWGWIEQLNKIGMQVIGLDFKGHGGSDKPTGLNAYGAKALVEDVIALLDHLNIKNTSFVGFSLGSIITLHLLHTYPYRCNASALIATGDGLIGIAPYTADKVLPELSNALDRPQFPKDLPEHIAAYWQFATDVGGSRPAAAAAGRGYYPPCSPKEISSIQTPMLVVSGECDPVLGCGPQMAAAFPKGEYIEIKGADHFQLSAHAEAQKAITDFLATHRGINNS